MKKSLLELLEEEKTQVSNIRFAERMTKRYKEKVENSTKHNSFNPESLEERIKKEECELLMKEYNNIILSYKQEVKEAEIKLLEIRKEIRKYFSFLME